MPSAPAPYGGSGEARRQQYHRPKPGPSCSAYSPREHRPLLCAAPARHRTIQGEKRSAGSSGLPSSEPNSIIGAHAPTVACVPAGDHSNAGLARRLSSRLGAAFVPPRGSAELESVFGVARNAAVAEQDFELAVDSPDLTGRRRGPAHRCRLLQQHQTGREFPVRMAAPRGTVVGAALAPILKLGRASRLAARGLDSAPAPARIGACCPSVAGSPECLGTPGAELGSLEWLTCLLAVACHR